MKLETSVEVCNEKYILDKINAYSQTDPVKARSWAFTMQTLFPNSYAIYFASYKLEKEADDHEWAAKSFSQIVLHHQCEDENFVLEIKEFAKALEMAYDEGSTVQNFFIKMLDFLSPEVLKKVLLLTLKHTEDALQQCKLILMMQRIYKNARLTHTHKLLEIIADGLKQNPTVYERLLLLEVIPLYNKELNLPAGALCAVYKEFLGCSMRKIIEESNKVDEDDVWKKLWYFLNLTGELLGWEPFLPFFKNWEKFLEIARKRISAGIFDTSILYYATTLFAYALHNYLKHCSSQSSDANQLKYVFVEGYYTATPLACETAAQITSSTQVSKQMKQSFVFASEAWSLLNREKYVWEFQTLLRALPVAQYISRFLFDLSISTGLREESQKFMSEMNLQPGLVLNLQEISLSLLQNHFTPASFEGIVKIMHNLPEQQGDYLENLTSTSRHMLFLPLTLRPIMQYCVKAILKAFFLKLKDDNPSDQMLGNMLVLLQLEMPFEPNQVTRIFEIIAARRYFAYAKFSNYIILSNFLEEFLHMHNTMSDFKLNIAAPTTINVSIRSLIKQQLPRANENLALLIANFIKEEHAQLAQCLFGEEKH